jgi:iron complex outermembrane receptor protein
MNCSGRQDGQVTRASFLGASTLTIAVSTIFVTSGYAHGQSPEQSLPAIKVTGARFASDPAFPPISASVISAEEIRQTGVSNVNAAIRLLGGVYGRQNLLGTSDFVLDLRGFGEQSSGNMVIVVDGVRFSESEQAATLLTSIPIDTVERIEISRGGHSVLYGAGATGGVIQIITKRPKANTAQGSIAIDVGTYGQRGVHTNVAKTWADLSLDMSYSSARADHYRHNNKTTQESFSGGLQWGSDKGRFGGRLDVANADYRLPGPLSYADWLLDARQTKSPLDFGSYDTNRITLFGEHRIGDIELAAEFSHHEKTATMYQDYGFGYTSDVAYTSRGDQFTPRLRYITESAAIKNELVVGVDLSSWQRNSKESVFATQDSQALYLRDEVQIDNNARIAFGVRRELITNRVDQLSAPYETTLGLNAWDLQASYAVLPRLRAYAKLGQSYRVANVDDNAWRHEVLQPQRSHDQEVGVTFGRGDRQIKVRWFQHRLSNEIAFDPMTYTNVNLDPTQRQGFEVEVDARINEQFWVTASAQQVKSRFREGINVGKEVALVPKHIVTARLNWSAGIHDANIGLQWVDTQRYGNDFNNTCAAVMPAYTTVDARYAVRLSGWEFSLAGDNLFNEKYFTNAYGCKGNIYPDAGRTLKFTARYDF